MGTYNEYKQKRMINMCKCSDCQEVVKVTLRGYCENCYPKYCCEECGDFVDEQHRLCDDCWEESDEYVED